MIDIYSWMWYVCARRRRAKQRRGAVCTPPQPTYLLRLTLLVQVGTHKLGVLRLHVPERIQSTDFRVPHLVCRLLRALQLCGLLLQLRPSSHDPLYPAKVRHQRSGCNGGKITLASFRASCASASASFVASRSTMADNGLLAGCDWRGGESGGQFPTRTTTATALQRAGLRAGSWPNVLLTFPAADLLLSTTPGMLPVRPDRAESGFFSVDAAAAGACLPRYSLGFKYAPAAG